MVSVTTDEELSAVLSEFTQIVAGEFSVPRILDHLVKRIVTMLPISAASVTLISPSGTPRYVASSDDAARRFEELQCDLDEGPCLTAYRTGCAVCAPDLRTEQRFLLFAPKALEIGLAAAFAFPLNRGDERFGALDLYREVPGPLDDHDLAAAQTLADVATAYIANAEMRSDLRELWDRSRANLLHDALTGLPNRVLLLERLIQALHRSRHSGRQVAILLIDLDGFKEVNDEHGYGTGDELLVIAAQRLKGELRPGDTLARLSGDEFVVLCEEFDSPDQAEAVAHRIVEALAVPFAISGLVIPLTASVGISFADHKERDPGRMLQYADVAKRQAKRTGGGRHQAFDLREYNVVRSDNNMERDLVLAMRLGELQLAYQPIVRALDGKIAGVEALLRWNSATRGPVPATTVIDLAERSGLILELGRWALLQACTDWQRWRGRVGADPFEMSVNVSAHQLMAPNFVATVTEIIAETRVDPHLLILEITESVFVSDPTRALLVLSELKRLGVRIALDDFGTGYSSLGCLKKFPVDIIKLDQMFIADLLRDRTSHAIVLKIIELAHLLKLSVVSEGIETAHQAADVANLGSDYCQGYYYSRPLTVDQLDRLMRRDPRGTNPSLPLSRRGGVAVLAGIDHRLAETDLTP